jgi:hypothetical protein
MKLKSNSVLIFMMLFLLISGCAPSEKEIKNLGFNSKEEMEKYKSNGFNSKGDYFKENISIIGKKILDASVTPEKTLPYPKSIQEIFPDCKLKWLVNISSAYALNCNISSKAELTDESSLVNFSIFNPKYVDTMNISSVVTGEFQSLPLFEGLKGVVKESIICRSVASSSNSSEKTSFFSIKKDGNKLFEIREDHLKVGDAKKLSTTIFFKNATDCEELAKRSADMDGVLKVANASNDSMSEPTKEKSVNDSLYDAEQKHDSSLVSVVQENYKPTPDEIQKYNTIPNSRVFDMYRKIDNDKIFISVEFDRIADAMTYCVAIENERMKSNPGVVPDINGNMGQVLMYTYMKRREICASRIAEMVSANYFNKDEALRKINFYQAQEQQVASDVVSDRGRQLRQMMDRSETINKILLNKFGGYVKWAISNSE